jgi:hypothetical protein
MKMSAVKVGMRLTRTTDKYAPIITVTNVFHHGYYAKEGFDYAHEPKANKLSMPDGSVQYYVTERGSVYSNDGECDYKPAPLEEPLYALHLRPKA